MVIEKDLATIKKVAREKDRENWEFRAFLKQLDIEIEELDDIVHRITTELISQIDCTACGNCYKRIRPDLDEEDITRFTTNLKISVKDLRDKYLTQGKDIYTKQIFNSLPCPFLKNNRCTNYEYRPKDCVSYPHLNKDKFVFRLWGVVDNYGICPIVFNVYNQLKKELWHFNEFKEENFNDLDF